MSQPLSIDPGTIDSEVSTSASNRSLEALQSNVLSAPVQEIFSSVQGEGPFVGERQLFVRFAHCHLKCAYCDTTMTTPDGLCHLSTVVGPYGEVAGEKSLSLDSFPKTLDNPVSVEALVGVMAQAISVTPHHAISFTGGEPLLYHRYLASVFQRLKEMSWPNQRKAPQLYLETSGTQPDFMASVLPWVDVVAMDFKLPSTTGEAPRYAQHAEFITVCQQRPEINLFIKLIFDESTSLEEWQAVCDSVSDPTLPIFLQPVTSLVDQQIHVSSQAILKAEAILSKHFHQVRVVPQTHKMIQVQ